MGFGIGMGANGQTHTVQRRGPSRLAERYRQTWQAPFQRAIELQCLDHADPRQLLAYDLPG